MGAIRWGTRGRVPPTFSDSGDLICHVPHIFLFSFRNISVSHQAVPLTFYNKIALMHTNIDIFAFLAVIWQNLISLIAFGPSVIKVAHAWYTTICETGSLINA